MAVEDAAKDERCHRDRFLRAEADDDVEIEALEIRIAGGPSIPAGAGWIKSGTSSSTSFA
jgi:hypothetical protein